MAEPRPFTPDAVDEIRKAAAAGKSLHSIAAEMGFTKPRLSRFCAKADPPILFDRGQTEAATNAKIVDAKARRAALVLRSLARAEALYDRLEQPEFRTLTRGQGGAEQQETLSFVPPRDERDLAVTIRTHLDASLRLEQHDSGTGGTVVIGLLQQTAAALGLTDGDDATS